MAARLLRMEKQLEDLKRMCHVVMRYVQRHQMEETKVGMEGDQGELPF